jgi:hypothetical protein
VIVKKKRNAEACVFIFGGCAPLLDLRKLEAADVVAGRRVGQATEKSGKRLDMPDIVVLRLLAEAPDRHVRDHAAAKIADRLVAHRRLLS